MGEDGPTTSRVRLIAQVTAPAAARVAARGLGGWLAGAAPRAARGELAIALISDAEMRRLNREYRGVDRATDVLSFVDCYDLGFRTRGRIQPRVQTRGPVRGRTQPRVQTRGPVFLGDIAIAVGVARRQARAHRHSLAIELRVLALHGLLHLLGYDHDADRGEMRTMEERLRARAGLPTGLIARTASRAVPR